MGSTDARSLVRGDDPGRIRRPGAPAGTRTLTETILSRLPLPIGLPGPEKDPSGALLLADRATDGNGSAGGRLVTGGRLRAGGELLERRARLDTGLQRDCVAADQEVDDPVAEDAGLALPHRHREAVVAAVHEPRERALDGDVARLEHAVPQTEARDGALVLVEVVPGRFASDVAGD